MARALRPDEPGWTDHVLNHGNAQTEKSVMTPFLRLPANVSTTVYVQGIGESDTPGAEQVGGSLTLNGSTYALAPLNAHVFEMDGPLDVPGGGTYTYTSDADQGTWVNPTGGYASATSLFNFQIKWDNTAQLGLANFKASPQYTWSDGVNVVQLSLTSSQYTPGGPPGQDKGGAETIDSDPGYFTHTSQAMALDAQVQLTGFAPVAGEAMRGVEFISVGIVQNVQHLIWHEVLTDNSIETCSLEGQTWYADSGAAYAPWYDKGGGPPGVRVGTTDSPQPTYDNLNIADSPTTVWNPNPNNPVTSLDSLANYRDFVIATTNQAPISGTRGYSVVAQGSWYFNGDGQIDSTGKWTKTDAAVGGDAVLSVPAKDEPKTAGPFANDLLSQIGPTSWK